MPLCYVKLYVREGQGSLKTYFHDFGLLDTFFLWKNLYDFFVFIDFSYNLKLKFN